MSSGPGSNVWVHVHGRYWHLRDVPAVDWIHAAVSEDMVGIWPGLVDDADAEQLFDLWMTEPDMRARSSRVARKALERAGNREWHWSLNMIKEIRDSWTYLNGLLVRQGVRADQVNLDDYLDAAYTVFQEKLPGDDLKAFNTRLRKIPAGVGEPAKPRMSSRADLMQFAKD